MALRGSVGAPARRSRQRAHESQAQGTSPLGGNALHLVTDDLKGAIGQEPGEQPQLLADARGIGKNTVEGHQRGDCRKEREKTIEGHTGGDQQDTVFLNALKDAPAYVPPALGGNVRRRGGRAPAVARIVLRACWGLGCLEPEKARNMPTAAAASHKGFRRELSLRDWNRLTKRSSYDCERLTPGHAACSFGALLRQNWAPNCLDLCGGRANRPTNFGRSPFGRT